MEYVGKSNAHLKFNNQLSNPTIRVEIDADRPIYIVVTKIGGSSSHAMVLRGYEQDNSLYSYWNPWNDFYESVSISYFTVNLNGSNYEWTHTIHEIY